MRSFVKLLPLLTIVSCAAPRHDPAEANRGTGVVPAFAPKYTEDGKLIRPGGYETWIFVGASIGLGYSESSNPSTGPGVFHNVYTQHEAYEEFGRTGSFPEKTLFILALYEPRQRESINRQGYFEGDPVALEVAVKDREQFQDGWAYFDFGKGGLDASASAKPTESCHSCHKEHGAADNVFVQFYPSLRGLTNRGWENRGSQTHRPATP